ncbi:MAG TPA: hypothetical protein VNO14_15040 [Blastocatellia bacterium]|nr:hypothetical protein [Blastocatellia bacterium]
MKIVLSTFKKVLFWSYERGSWQYDLMCVLILAFIFLLPTALFVNRDHTTNGAAGRAMYLSRDEVKHTDPQRIDQEEINDILARKYGHPVVISRIEEDKDASGVIKGYFIWEKE